MKTKVCTICRVEKELSEFYKDKFKKYGVKNQCKVCTLEKQKEYDQQNRQQKMQYNKEYYQQNREQKIQRSKKHYQQNREVILKRHNEYEQKPEVKERRSKRTKQRRKSDPNFKIKLNLRNRLYYALKGQNKSASTLELLGCSIEHLREHLESQFQEGMTFENYGDWHIDHIRPCASFDLKDPKQQKECFHYTNLQPLWASENLSKGAKYEQ